MAKTMKLRVWSSWDDDHGEDYSINAMVFGVGKIGQWHSLFHICPSSCCTKPHQYKENAGCDYVADALMKILTCAVMGKLKNRSIRRMLDMEIVTHVEPYMKKPVNIRKFATMIQSFHDAFTSMKNFDQEIILYP